jgi:cytochrome c oxidase assembly protein subunit 15
MTTGFTTGKNFVSKRHCYLLLTATLMTYLLITMGGIVCITESGRGCPDWPGCYGRIVPMMRMDSVIEYMHRLVAALTSPFILAAAIVGRRQSRDIRWVSRPPALAVAFLVAVAGLGARAVLRGLSPLWAAVDLGLALLVLALMVSASVVAFTRYANPTLPDRLWFRGSFARLSLWMSGAIFAVLVSGVVVDGDSIARCLGWPLYFVRWAPIDLHGWLQLSRRLFAGAASVLIIAVFLQAWRTQRTQAAIVRGATMVGVFFFAEISVGAVMLARGSNLLLLGIYVALAAALWASSVALVVWAASPYSDVVRARISAAQATAA